MSTPVAARLRVTAARTARELAFLVDGLAVGVVSFVVAVVGLAVGASLLVVGIGLPVLVTTLAACRRLAARERHAVERVTGRALPPHRYRPPPRGPDALPDSRTRRDARAWRDAVRDPQAWRDALHAVIALPLNVLTSVVALTCTVGGLAGLLYVTWEWALPHGEGDTGLVGLVTGVPSRSADIVLHTLLGAALLAAAPRVLTALVALRAAVARGLLTRPADVAARAAELATSRRSAVRAEAQMLRRLERDLHDGPQQRLVRLGMDLETAGRRLDDPDGDPRRARTLITEALEQSREALAELRALSRGIAPPILADRGLAAALAAAAARSPTAVSLDVVLPGPRPPAAIENAAYFVVTEALTNVAKHARSDTCAVVVRGDRERLVVTVHDDGTGGAHLGKGHGLAGLADRLAAVDGRLEVVSPPGGPTVVRAELPLREEG